MQLVRQTAFHLWSPFEYRHLPWFLLDKLIKVLVRVMPANNWIYVL